VRRDPRDEGDRRFLNFGHTLGTRSEAQVLRGLTHGEHRDRDGGGSFLSARERVPSRGGPGLRRARQIHWARGARRDRPGSTEYVESSCADTKFTSRARRSSLSGRRSVYREVSAAEWKKEVLLAVLAPLALIISR